MVGLLLPVDLIVVILDGRYEFSGLLYFLLLLEVKHRRHGGGGGADGGRDLNKI